MYHFYNQRKCLKERKLEGLIPRAIRDVQLLLQVLIEQ